RREGYDPLFAFLERFAGATAKASAEKDDEGTLQVEERLKRRIIDGKKLGMEKHLDEALRKYKPFEIINAAKILPLSKLSPEDIAVTLELIYDKRREGYDPLFAFLERFAGATAKASAEKDDE